MLQRRILLFFLAIGLAGLAGAGAALAASDDGVHRLALQVSDNDPQKMNAVLNVAANVSRHYSEIGEAVEIEIVAFNLGLHMLRQDTSPVAERITNFAQSMPNVTFQACGNTIDSMTRKEGKAPPIFDFAQHVQAGVVRLIELNEAGWTIVRP